MKDLLVHVDDTPAGAARMASAIKLAEAQQAHLTGLHVRPAPDVPPCTSLNRLVSLSDSATAAVARRSRKLFDAAVAKTDIPHWWLGCKGDVAANIAAQSRYADLVIVGQHESQGAVHHPLPACHRCSVRSGRPFLVPPGSASIFVQFAGVLIARDGSRESVRAVHDAVAFLSRAETVTVIIVGRTKQSLLLTSPIPLQISH